jgi:hypothetical protein
MTAPNLFRIASPSIPSPFSEPILAIAGDSLLGVPNLVASDLGCFQGDCLCCPEDGSGRPIVSIVWEDGRFIYYTLRADFSTIAYTYGGIIENAVGDISGEISTISSEFYFGGSEELQGYYYTLSGNNSCGGLTVTAYCVSPFCFGYMSIDCEKQKILLTTQFYFSDALNYNEEIYYDYYNLGSVPDIFIEKNNKCGPRCRIEITPPCLYNKNSIIYDFKDFRDFFGENFTDYGGTEYIGYTSRRHTGLSVFNNTYILPLYIAPCNISSGSIRYNIPAPFTLGLGTITDYSYLSFNGNIISSNLIEYNVEYFMNGMNPSFRVLNYTNNGNFVECPRINDYFCGGGILFSISRYEDEDENNLEFPYSYSRDPFCGRVLVNKYYTFGTDPAGILRVYYDNL